jgi:hypothetical protein
VEFVLSVEDDNERRLRRIWKVAVSVFQLLNLKGLSETSSRSANNPAETRTRAVALPLCQEFQCYFTSSENPKWQNIKFRVIIRKNIRAQYDIYFLEKAMFIRNTSR